jgi:hypothetical protein
MRGARIFLIFTAFFAITASVLAQEVRYDRGERRDPFIPLIGPEGFVDARKFDTSDLNIEGIIHDPKGESLVLINGEFYKEGDDVKGANVISIFQDRIILGQSDEQKTIWIREEIVSGEEVKNAATPKK